jgi:hypothetical protein
MCTGPKVHQECGWESGGWSRGPEEEKNLSKNETQQILPLTDRPSHGRRRVAPGKSDDCEVPARYTPPSAPMAIAVTESKPCPPR